jgi:hypothetical protein
MCIWILSSSKTCLFHRIVGCGLDNQCYCCGRGRNFSPFSSVHHMGSISSRGKITKLTTHPHTAMIKLDPCIWHNSSLTVCQLFPEVCKSECLFQFEDSHPCLLGYDVSNDKQLLAFWKNLQPSSYSGSKCPRSRNLTNCQSTIHHIPEGLNHYCHHHHSENLEFGTVTVLLVFSGTSLYHHTRFHDHSSLVHEMM